MNFILLGAVLSEDSASADSAKDVAESAPKEKDGKFERIATLFSIAVALFGVGQYVYDTMNSRIDDRKERSIAYIERFGDGDMLMAREDLAQFWADHPSLIAALGASSISARSYNAILSASIFKSKSDINIQSSLLKIDNFFTQVGFCKSSGLCDSVLVDKYFCLTAQKYAFAYGPFFEQISSRTGDASIGEKLEQYSIDCN